MTKRILYPLFLLLIPLIGTFISDEINWSLFDFIVIGFGLIFLGTAINFVVKREKNLGKDGARSGWGILARLHPKGMDESSVITYDHYKDLSSALRSLSPMDVVSSKEIDALISKSKMSKYDPDGFRYTDIWELIELLGSPQ